MISNERAPCGRRTVDRQVYLKSLKIDEVIGESKEGNGENSRQRSDFHSLRSVSEASAGFAFVTVISVHGFHIHEHTLNKDQSRGV